MSRTDAKGIRVRLQGQDWQGRLSLQEGIVVRLRTNIVTISVRSSSPFSNSNNERRYCLQTGRPIIPERYSSYQIVEEDLARLRDLL